MCPTDLTEEEQEVLEVAEEVSEEKDSTDEVPVEDTVPEDPVVDSGQDQEFEGVDSIEDIPKGKEKNYGI